MARASRSPEELPSACPAAWLWLLVGIFIGIFLAFLFYLKQLAPLATHAPPPAEPAAVAPNAPPAPLELPPQAQTKPSAPPRFEFYDMLPKSEVAPPPGRLPPEAELAQIQAADAQSAAPVTASAPPLPPPMRPEDFPVAGEPYPPAANPVTPAAETAPAPAAGTFMLQIAAFRDQRAATDLQTALGQQGWSGVVQQALVNGVPWYRVKVGPYATQAQAQQAQAALQQRGYQPLVQKF